MNTLKFYKDAVSVKYERTCWQDIVNEMHAGTTDWIDMQAMNDEAAELYAEEACKEQRRICADGARYVKIFSHISVNKESILNAPLAVNTDDSALAVRKEPLK